MATQIEVPTPGTRTAVEEIPATTSGAAQSEAATHNYRAVQYIWLVAGVVTTLIAFRFVLKLLGASLQSGFVTFVYGVTDFMVAPFRAIFPAASGSSSSIDIASLVALVVYALVAWGLVSLVKLMTAPRGARSVS